MNIIVTGANTGIGFEAVNSLLAINSEHKIFLACRGEAKANEAIEKLKLAHPNAKNLEFLPLDLNDLQSVQAAAKFFLAKNIPLHILILNAGILSTTSSKTVQGYESMFGVNHLGHFLFTLLLLPVLKTSVPSRIVVVASDSHGASDKIPDLEALPHREYSLSTFYTGYGNSKLLNIFFTNELARRLEGTGVTVNSLHPGAVKTELGRSAPWYFRPVLYLIGLAFLTPAQGAQTTVYVATSKDIEGVSGKYFTKSKEAPTKPHAQNKELEGKLWEMSTKLVEPYL